MSRNRDGNMSEHRELEEEETFFDPNMCGRKMQVLRRIVFR